MFTVLFITAIGIAIFIKIVVTYQDKIKFYSQGQDKGFKLNEVSLLWKLAKETKLDEPQSLYWSVPSLNQAISELLANARHDGTENSPEIQNFLTRLYDFRTKIDIEHDKKRGLESTKYLDAGQKLRIILKGHGIFNSTIMNNGREFIIKTPLQNGIIKVPGEQWTGKQISVYLWRKGDAGYVFDTNVLGTGVFYGQSVLHLAHTSELLRTQKRKSVRCECELTAQMYFSAAESFERTAIESQPGYKVLLEDISADGALIRVGGKGRKDVQIKIQFELEGKTIVMFGIVRAVEYNENLKQSRLHFECTNIEQENRNEILSFVYKILPEDKKEAMEAIAQTEEDAKDLGENPDEIAEEEPANDKTNMPDENAQESQNSDNSEPKTKKTYPTDGPKINFEMKPVAIDDLAELDVSEK